MSTIIIALTVIMVLALAATISSVIIGGIKRFESRGAMIATGISSFVAGVDLLAIAYERSFEGIRPSFSLHLVVVLFAALGLMLTYAGSTQLKKPAAS